MLTERSSKFRRYLFVLAVSMLNGCQLVQCICEPSKCGTREVHYPAESDLPTLSLVRGQRADAVDANGCLWPDKSDTPVPYLPREGDIVLMSSYSPVYALLFSLGGTGHPLHAAIVVKDSQGELCLFEVGVLDGRRVSLTPVDERFSNFFQERVSPTIWIRTLRVPLCEDRSRALTNFAESQRGKEFSYFRSANAAISGNWGSPSTPEQSRWFCSELVVEALRQADLVDRKARPQGTVPSDLYYNKKMDLDALWLSASFWTPCESPPKNRPWLAPSRPK